MGRLGVRSQVWLLQAGWQGKDTAEAAEGKTARLIMLLFFIIWLGWIALIFFSIGVVNFVLWLMSRLRS
jgi:hypothetical protein